MLPLFVADQVVTDFQEEMGDAARLAMHRDRIVGKVVNLIGLVVSRVYHWVLRPEGVEEPDGKAAIAVGEGAEMPGPLATSGEPGREAVDGHEDRCRALHGALVQERRKCAVERLVDLFKAQTPLPVGQFSVAGNECAVAQLRKAVRSREWPVAVDHQATVALNHERCIEQRR